MAAELERLARTCDSLNLKEEAALSRGWLPKSRTDQQILFLPSRATKRAPSSNDARAAWSKHFASARGRHAEFWWHQAQSLAVNEREQAAYRAVWRTLREDPQHALARRALGEMLVGLEAKVRLSRPSTAHPQLGWQAGTYNLIDTPHFQVTTRADARQSAAFASQLESFYALWTQVFYPLWAAPNQMRSRFDSGTSDLNTKQEIQVVLLRSRKEYIDVLGAKEENIGISVGYYNPELKTSFFYPDQNLQATLFHELTHQLLAEATHIDAKPEAGSISDYWLLEGIAMYMESMWEGTEYWTVGGWESPRLQVARYRALREDFWVPWETIRSGGLESWKQDPNVAKLYTQAAGLTHYCMDSASSLPDNAAPASTSHPRDDLLRALVSIYQGQSPMDDLFAALDDDSAQEKYKRFLKVTDQDVLALAPNRALQDLVLVGSQLSDQAWQALGQHKSLRWLDIAFTNARSQHVQWLRDQKNLRRLSLEGTAVDAQAIEAAAAIPLLEELDLSSCLVDDRALDPLAGHRNLKTLWLTKTRVTDAALATIDKIPNLSFVDVQGSRVSTEAWRAFSKTHPKIKP